MISNNTFMDIAKTIGNNSKCTRAKVGAIIVKGNRIISCGYNGLPAGADDRKCKSGCQGCKYTVHAEQNAIVYAAKEGITVESCIMYITHSPCINCALLIIQSGIKEVYFGEYYQSDISNGHEGVNLLIESGIKTICLDKKHISNLIHRVNTYFDSEEKVIITEYSGRQVVGIIHSMKGDHINVLPFKSSRIGQSIYLRDIMSIDYYDKQSANIDKPTNWEPYTHMDSTGISTTGYIEVNGNISIPNEVSKEIAREAANNITNRIIRKKRVR